MSNNKLNPLVYLKRELDFKVAEFQALSKEDQTELRKWAVEEMVVLDREK